MRMRRLPLAHPTRRLREHITCKEPDRQQERGQQFASHLTELHPELTRVSDRLHMPALTHRAVRDRRVVPVLHTQWAARARPFLTVLKIRATVVHAMVRIVPVVSLLLNLMLNVSPFASVSADP